MISLEPPFDDVEGPFECRECVGLVDDALLWSGCDVVGDRGRFKAVEVGLDIARPLLLDPAAWKVDLEEGGETGVTLVNMSSRLFSSLGVGIGVFS